MQFNAVIDISSIIWQESDYNLNKHHYYNLLKSISLFLKKFKKEKPIVLIRDELLREMSISFPSSQIPNDFWYVTQQVYSFLADSESNFISYPSNITPNLVSIPNIVKPYYIKTVVSEVNYLLSKIHTDTENKNIFFTFEYLWENQGELKTQLETTSKKYQTIITDRKLSADDDLTELDDFFEKNKLTFKHKSPKHDCSVSKNRDAWNVSDDKGNFESQLSCYCDNDASIVQDILDKRCKTCFGNNSYYGYDSLNNVYVVFRITLNNIYHAYDMYDIERVPQEVKKEFNIWRY